jgi:hypothetical protein
MRGATTLARSRWGYSSNYLGAQFRPDEIHDLGSRADDHGTAALVK